MMAERPVTIWPGTAPHHGPFTPDCPIECLLHVLSVMSFNRLSSAKGAPFYPPRTVGDVLQLHARRELRKIRGLGPRRSSEIEASLVFAGLELSEYLRQPANEKRPAT